MKTAMDTLKDLSVEVKQWQSRVDHAKSENDRLTNLNEELKKESNSIRSSATQHAEKERATTRQEMNKLSELKMTLDLQKSEFEKVLADFKQQKLSADKERETLANLKAEYAKMNERVSQFMLLVRREAERL